MELMTQIHKRYSINCLALTAALLIGCIEGDRGEKGEPGEMGEMGERGEMGEKGDMGEPGKDADSYRPSSLAECSATLDVIAVADDDSIQVGEDGVKETGLRATMTNYSNGDVEVTCLVAIGSGAGGSVSAYHIAGTSGADNRACGVIAEYPLADDGNAGSWRFRGVGGKMQAQYADTGNPLNGKTYDFTEDNCIGKVLGDDGKWSDADLADILN